MTPSDQPVPTSAISAPLPAWGSGVLARRTQSLLQAQVPLSLLLDLADPFGLDSQAMYAAEPADDAWLATTAG